MKILFSSLLFVITFNFGSAQMEMSADLNLSDRFSMGSETYGSACGFAGEDPELRKEAHRLYAAEDVSELESWLSSGSNIHKAYAAEYLIRINNSGMAIDADTKKEINITKESTAKVSACRGCIYERITLAEALAPFELKD